MLTYKRSKVLSLKGHPEYSERWLHEHIVQDPELLGLGDLVVRDVERRQPRAGRLDLLLADVESGTRYEVEIQLGATDETHIIRTLEYWDIERRRYPQYDHVAVIVAEDITSRFLNVIGLFNGFIPLIAIQLRALEVDGVLTLSATKVVDVVTLGTDEEDDASASEPVDRAFWMDKSSPATMGVADRLLDLIRDVTGDAGLDMKYNKYYIGLARNGVPDNFVYMRPRRNYVLTSFKIPRSDELSSRIEDEGLEMADYDTRDGSYRAKITPDDLASSQPLLKELVARASGTPLRSETAELPSEPGDISPSR